MPTSGNDEFSATTRVLSPSLDAAATFPTKPVPKVVVINAKVKQATYSRRLRFAVGRIAAGFRGSEVMSGLPPDQFLIRN